ncbi:TlpA disulfide reductase family protein [Camelimonas fluminis]|uniref:TlpA disulfide reductase family protein n=1 Tax=Camelimonas fluminis TaxID=1576911 RepID=A0ABV7UNW1_9HYPH|nr:TlpA disulfide reductase family protein [Camelimonas fluminis]
MSDNKSRAPRIAAVAVLAVALLGAGVYWLAQDRNVSGGPGGQCPARDMAPLAGLAKGDMAGMRILSRPEKLPEFTFVDGAGAVKTMADFKGKVTLLNLWATWCAPCKLEMPALNALQGAMGGKDFEVLAINMDSRDAGKPREWLKDNKIDHLAYYADTPGKIFQALRGAGRASGLPVTLLVNRDGCLVGQLDGAAEWHSDDAKALVKGAVGG